VLGGEQGSFKGYFWTYIEDGRPTIDNDVIVSNRGLTPRG